MFPASPPPSPEALLPNRWCDVALDLVFFGFYSAQGKQVYDQPKHYSIISIKEGTFLKISMFDCLMSPKTSWWFQQPIWKKNKQIWSFPLVDFFWGPPPRTILRNKWTRHCWIAGVPPKVTIYENLIPKVRPRMVKNNKNEHPTMKQPSVCNCGACDVVLLSLSFANQFCTIIAIPFGGSQWKNFNDVGFKMSFGAFSRWKSPQKLWVLYLYIVWMWSNLLTPHYCIWNAPRPGWDTWNVRILLYTPNS